MHPNEQLIHTFYQGFQERNPNQMNACYAEDVLFSDPVFTDLGHREVCGMWEMLIKRGKDLEVTYENIVANDREGSADWTATYSFGTKKNKVVNHIHATFEFTDGKIVRHLDQFNFPRWASQALGPMGWILGRSKYLHRKVQKMAVSGLEAYLNK